MGKVRAKRHHPTFKFKIVLESFIEQNVAEVARKYDLNSNQLSNWRKQFLDRGHLIFQIDKTNREKRLENKITSLENLIGKKEIELSLLKNFLDYYAPKDTD